MIFSTRLTRSLPLKYLRKLSPPSYVQLLLFARNSHITSRDTYSSTADSHHSSRDYHPPCLNSITTESTTIVSTAPFTIIHNHRNANINPDSNNRALQPLASSQHPPKSWFRIGYDPLVILRLAQLQRPNHRRAH